MAVQLLPRLQLFEWEDQSFFPHQIRDALTNYLYLVWTVGGFYRTTLPVLEHTMHRCNRNHIYDLCSGGGGAWSHIVSALKERNVDIEVQLSDYYPNLKAFEALHKQSDGTIQFDAHSVNACTATLPTKAIVTLLLALHHFAPTDVEKILSNAVSQSSPIIIFEIQQRTVLDVLIMLIHLPICWIVMPFMKPTWMQLLLTYIVPVIPLCIVWDGMVSAMRTYTPEELMAMAHKVDPTGLFTWESGLSKHPLHSVSYFVGCPTDS